MSTANRTVVVAARRSAARATAAPSATVPCSSPAARAAASTANPSAIPTVRESTTCTGTPAVCAASSAEFTVPDSSADRCTETISRAPLAATLAYARANDSGPGCAVRTEAPERNASTIWRGLMSMPSRCGTPSTITSSGTTTIPAASTRPAGSDAVESVTTATWRAMVRPAPR